MSFINVNHGFLIEADLFNLESGDVLDISNSIIDIMVRKKFLEESFPLVVIDMKTTEEIRNMIRDNDCKIHLKVSYYNSERAITENNTDNDTVVPEGIVFENTIRIYEKPFSTTATKKDEDNDNSEDQTSAAPFFYYRVNGIPEELISMNEGNVNNVFSDAETVDALVYMLSSVGVENPRIQESENKDKYRNIIIPPVSIVPAVKSLQEYYLIYNDGLSLFFDYDGTYCFSPFSENRPVDNIFEVNVVSKNSSGIGVDDQKAKVDTENNNIKITLQSLPAFTKNTKVGKHYLGSETIYYTYDEYFNLSTRTRNDDESYSKIRYIWNERMDKRFEDNISNIYSKNSTMTIGIANLDPSLITPYTKLSIISNEYPEAQGEYIISDISYIIETTDLKHYKGSFVILAIKK